MVCLASNIIAGSVCTKITYLGFKGEFTTINKDPIITNYEIAANPSDHKLKGTALNSNIIE